MSYKAQGSIVHIGDTEQVTDTFKKRTLVLKMTDGEYTQEVAFEFTQDRCKVLDGYQFDQEVEVDFDLRGRKWTSPDGVDKWFNTLSAWRISVVNSGAETTTETSTAHATAEEEDDVPF